MQANNQSNMNASIGEFDETENCPMLCAKVKFSKEKADQCQQMLCDMGVEKADTEFSCCVVVPCEAGKEDELQKCIDILFTNEYQGRLLKGSIRNMFTKTEGPVPKYKSYTGAG